LYLSRKQNNNVRVGDDLYIDNSHTQNKRSAPLVSGYTKPLVAVGRTAMRANVLRFGVLDVCDDSVDSFLFHSRVVAGETTQTVAPIPLTARSTIRTTSVASVPNAGTIYAFSADRSVTASRETKNAAALQVRMVLPSARTASACTVCAMTALAAKTKTAALTPVRTVHARPRETLVLTGVDRVDRVDEK
jgi:hypothetical protein